MLLGSEDFHVLAGKITFNDLTFNGSAGSMKRGDMALSQHNNLPVPSGLDGLALATTSGRPLAMVVPLFSADTISSLYSQSIEIDALVGFHTQQLQSGMELLRRNNSGDIMMVVEQQAIERLNVKEMELDYVSQRNRELEELVKQMAAESQVWFHYAKINEAVVSSLRSKFEQVHTTQVSCPVNDVEEGYGDSGGDPFPAADEVEKASATENQIQRPCRVCREREVCVLLLPCRHLCVCKGCESRIETCPVCISTTNATIQVVVPSGLL